MKDSQNKKFYKRKISLLPIVLVIVILVLASIGGFFLYNGRNQSKEETKTPVANAGCAAITADKTEGKAPLTVTLKSKLEGKFNDKDSICGWKLGTKDLGLSQVSDGYCTKELTLNKVGNFKAGLTVKGLATCTGREIELKVPELSDQLKAEELQLKLSGVNEEDRKLLEENEKQN